MKQSTKQSIKRWMRYVPLALLLAIVVIVIFLHIHEVIKGMAAWFAFSFVVMLAFLACHALHFAMDAFCSDSDGRAEDESKWNPKKTAKDLYAEIIADKHGGLISLEQARLFAAIAVNAGGFQRRIVEEYEPVRHALRKRVTVDVEIPDSALRQLKNEENGDEPEERKDGYLFVPIAVSTQGVPYDDLKIYSISDEERIPTLTDPEYIRVAASVLHRLILSAWSQEIDNVPQAAKDIVVDAISAIVCHVSREAEHPQDGRNVGENIRSFFDNSQKKSRGTLIAEAALQASITRCFKGKAAKIPSFAKTSAGKANKTPSLAAAIVEILVSRRFKVVRIPVPVSGRFTFKYECILTPKAKPGKRWRPKLKGFGTLRWKTVQIWLNNASFCQTYHVIVRSSDNLYLFRQEIIPDYYLKIPPSCSLTAPYIRLRHLFGQSYANFYGRYLDPQNIQAHTKLSKPNCEIPVLAADFAEVPPGSLFVAAVAAATSAVLIWVAAIAVKHHSAGSEPIPTDLPVLILAFPGVAAAWLGFDTTDSKLFEGSLIARLSLFLTAVLSLLAAVLYIGFSQPVKSQGQLMTLGIANRWWWGLTVAGIVNAVILCYLWVLNWWRYTHFHGNV